MTGYQIADLAISILITGLLISFLVFKIKKKTVWVIFGIELVLLLIFGFLNLNVSFYICFAIFIASIVLIGTINLVEIRKIFAVSVKSAKINTKSLSDESRQRLIKNITTAVQWLSDNKTGALITFERNDSLDKYIDSGTIINCPVTPEIIETIFYEGTRLHDGAMIIRGDNIVAAAVFFTATTRNLIGKYGARHRAALGVSESSDSVTIVVSEETGRISIAYAGSLEPVKYDEFEKIFSTFIVSSPSSLSLTNDKDK